MKRRIYTEAEINDVLARLEIMRGEKVNEEFRRFFVLLNDLGLINALCEVCAEEPKETQPTYEWFKSVLDEAQRRVSA